VENQSSLHVAAGQTLTLQGNNLVFNQTSGTITAEGAVNFPGNKQVVNLNGGTLALANGMEISGGGTFNFNGGQASGTATLLGSSLNLGPAATSPMTFVLSGQGGTWTGDLRSGQTVWVRGDARGSHTSITVPAGLRNDGRIWLESANFGYESSLHVTSGTLVNAPGAVIDVNAGTGGARVLEAGLLNQGTFNANATMSLGRAGATIENQATIHTAQGQTVTVQGDNLVFTQTSGALNADGPFNLGGNRQVFNLNGGTLTLANGMDVVGSTFNFNSGQAAGVITFVNGTLHRTPAANSPMQFIFSGSQSTWTGDIASGQDFWIRGDSRGSHTSMTVSNGFRNDGHLRLESMNAGYESSLHVPTGTVVNGPAGVIDVNPGTGGIRVLDASLLNQGVVNANMSTTLGKQGATVENRKTINLAAGATLSLSGVRFIQQDGSVLNLAGTLTLDGATFDYNGGQILGTPRGNRTVLNLGPLATAPASFILTHSDSTWTGDLKPGQDLWLRGDSTGGNMNSTLARGFRNDGHLRLESANTAYDTSFKVTQGSVTNGPGGVIDVNQGTGGTRTLASGMVNLGTLNVNWPLTLGKPGEGLTSAGTVNVGPAATLTVAAGVNLTDGRLAGNGTVVADVSSSAIIAPAGTLKITGNLTLRPGGTLEFDLGPATSDQLVVSGTASLAGRIRARLAEGFTPADGTAFMLLTSAAIANMGVIPDLPPLPSGLAWELRFTGSGLLATVRQSAAGGVDIVGTVKSASGAGIAGARVHATQTSAPPQGLTAEYWDDITTNGTPILVRIDPTVNFDWGSNSPDARMGSDAFEVRWTGTVTPSYTETYTFYTTSDDGVRLWVNGQQLVDNWTDHSATENQGSVALQAGHAYDLRMEMYDRTGAAVAKLAWSSASQAKGPIPAAALQPPAGAGAGPSGLLEFSTVAGPGGDYTLHVPAGTWSVGVSGLEDLGYNPVDDIPVTAGPASNPVNLVAQPFSGTTYPDLVVTSIAIPAGAVAGQPVELRWTVLNQGRATAVAPWSEALFLAHDPAGSDAQPFGALPVTDPLPAGASAVHTRSIILPPTLTGRYYAIVKADSLQQVDEHLDEGNNSGVSTTFMEMLAADLVVTQVAVTPGTQFGQTAQVTWSVKNQGGAPALAAWVDGLYLSSSPSAGGAALATAAAGPDTPLAPGATYQHTATVTLPLGAQSLPGSYYVLVRADDGGIQPESNEGNNLTASTPFPLQLPPRPNLTVTTIVPPGALVPGRSFDLQWTVANTGQAPATGPWTEQIALSRDALVGNDVALASLQVSDPIPAGGSITRTLTVQLPATTPAGDFQVLVTTDSGGAVAEEREDDNSLFAMPAIHVPTTLTLSVSSDTVREDATNPALRGRVVRSGDTAQAMTVTLSCSSPDRLTLPPTVIIPVGQTTAGFDLAVVPDHHVTGDLRVTLGASADGALSDQFQVTLVDTDQPRLILAVNPPQVTEGGSAVATVTRDALTTEDLKVQLLSSDSSQLLTPESVIIPAGQTSASGAVVAVDDLLVETTQAYRLTASSPGLTSSFAVVTVLDNDRPQVALEITPSHASEGSGGSVLSGLVTRTPVTEQPVTLTLASDNPQALIVPKTVLIPASQASARFPVIAVNNDLVDGPKSVTVSATLLTSFGEQPLPPAVAAGVTVDDDDGPTLSLKIRPGLAREGVVGAATGTLTRNTDTADPVTVTIGSSHAAKASGPATVTIPAGRDAVTFPIATHDDGLTSGNERVVFSASAPGFTAGTDALVVTDTDLPDLVGTELTLPTDAATGALIPVSFRVLNQGSVVASGSWSQRLYFSKDGLVDDQDILVGDYPFTGDLPPGLSFKQVLSVFAPKVPGTYHLLVVVDTGSAINEVLEDNNTTVSDTVVNIAPAYSAVAETDLQVVPMGTPIPVHGTATKLGGGPAAFELVSIHIVTRGVDRVIAALTDATGAFAATFTPLPFEAGNYTLGAAHPSLDTAPVQDNFTILGFTASPTPLENAVVALGTVLGDITLNNTGEGTLTDIHAEAVGGLDVELQFLPPANLPPGVPTPLHYIIRSMKDESAEKLFSIHITASGGAVIDLPVHLLVQPRRPRLQVTPSSLELGMVRGQPTLVDLQVMNVGGAASSPIQVLLPNLPWMKVVTPLPAPALDPAASTRITVQLTPGDGLPLGLYEGTLAVSTDAGDIGVPFKLRHVSDARGDLRITTVDEATYYGAGGASLGGVTVVLRDPFGDAIVAQGITDTNGVLLLPGLPEGKYNLAASAPKHENSTGVVEVKSGATNEQLVFMPSRLVEVRWVVEEIEVEDITRIRIESTFETKVPIPVVTVEPKLIDLGQITGDEGQIDVTLTNQGLIAAQDVTLNFPTHPLWTITPLARQLGALPAKSSLTIPVLFRRVPQPAPPPPVVSLAALAPPAPSAPCNISASVEWKLICGPFDIAYPIPIPIINASGDCSGMKIIDGTISLPHGLTGIGSLGGGGGGSGGGGGGGGGGTGTSRVTVRIDPVPPTLVEPNRCVCNPKNFKEGCVKGSIPFDLPLGDVLKAAVNTALPPWGKLKGVSVKVSLDGEVCDCCKDGIHSIRAKGEAKAEGEIKILVGFNPELKGSAVVEGLGDVEYEGSLQAGVLFTVKAFVKGSLETECQLAKPKLCISGGASGTVFAGVEGSAKLTAKLPDGTKIGGSAKATGGIQTGLSFTISYCQGSGLSASACFDGLTLVAKVEGEVSYTENGAQVKKSAKLDASKKLVEPACYPEKKPTPAELAASDPYKDVDQETLARWFGFKSAAEMQAAVAARTPPTPAAATSLVKQADAVAPPAAPAGGSVCAQVRLLIEQQAALTRKAVGASLEIDNNSTTDPLADILVNIDIYDDAGNLVNNRFVILDPTVNVFVPVPPTVGADGFTLGRDSWTLSPGLTGSARWVILPLDEAAPDQPTLYRVGGELSYSSGGVVTAMRLTPTPVTVYPNAKLHLKYFHQRDVLADDPFTDVIEPSQPFTLAVMVQNSGNGVAKNFHITSAQPKIVDNKKGLLVDFTIIGTEVAGQNLSPSLTVNFGDLNPHDVVIGRWLLKSTLQGLFIDYNASFEHEDQFGGKLASLIDDVAIHELIRVVDADGALEDGRPDFLANDVEDDRDLPDTLHLSDFTTLPVAAVTTGSSSGTPTAGSPQVTLTATLPPGWAYLRVPDPSGGAMILRKVIRKDGSTLPAANAWTTDRTFLGLARDPVKENILHLLDYNSAGSYTLVFEMPPPDDVIAPQSAVTGLPAQSGRDIAVKWAGSDQGSGISSYDIYVSVDHGPFVPWLQKTPLTGAIYRGDTGRRYSFYSIARDQAGNVENPPVTPDTETLVTIVNTPPILTLDPNVYTVNEGTTVVLTSTATDADVPANRLTFSLGADAPRGATIDPNTGRVQWITSEAHGPSVNVFTVRVTDDGTPRLFAETQVTVNVLEVNSPPAITPIPDRTINEGSLLVVDPQATDTDLPVQKLTWSLAPGTPSAASIDRNTGRITWKPGETEGGAVYPFTVVVKDDGPGALTGSQTFKVTVRDNRGDFQLTLGSAIVNTGDAGSVPIALDSGLALRDIAFTVMPDPDVLGDLAVQTDLPNIVATLVPLDPGYELRFAGVNGAELQGKAALGRFAFGTDAGDPSALVYLRPSEARGTDAATSTVRRGAATPGQVIVIGQTQPVLTFTRSPAPAVNVYGRPGRSYELQSSPDVDGPWTAVTRTKLVTNLSVVPLPPLPPGGLFYRAVEVTAP
jgi:hypothetical protein